MVRVRAICEVEISAVKIKDGLGWISIVIVNNSLQNINNKKRVL